MGVLTVHEQTISRGPTPELWRNFPVANIFHNRDLDAGYGIEDDFTSFYKASMHPDAANEAGITKYFGSGGALIYQDASSYIRQQSGVNGQLLLFNTADNEECWIQWGGQTGSPFLISDTPANMATLIFEARIKFTLITDSKSGWFIGLMEEGAAIADTIADAGTLVDKDMLGFHRLEGDGDKLDIVYNKAGAGGINSHKTDWATLVADTWIKVGFIFDATLGTIVPWVDGVADTTNTITAADIAVADFPDGEELSPIIGGKNAHADDASMVVDWIRVGQLSV